MNAPTLAEQVQEIIDFKTKPKGALGRLEIVAHQVCMIQQTTSPDIRNAQMIVFAADHGIAETGIVNPYPQEVTAQMVLNFLNDGAAINVFCRQHNIGLTIVDAGVNYDFSGIQHPHFIQAKIAGGTRNYMQANAMSEEQVKQCIRLGRNIASRIIHDKECNCIAFGEMGIGNTSSASLIMSAITGIPVEQCAGRGTGMNDQQLKTKRHTLAKIVLQHRLDEHKASPLSLLAKVGGFEIAMMTGAYLQAYEEKMIIVVDGFIATAALLVAQVFEPAVTNYCIYAHTSGEEGHARMLSYLHAMPLLDLGMRLGEGTGAALAIPLIQSAVNFYNEMATFKSASVSNAIS